ncbi:ATP-dependent zinc protease family protein [Teredinibacter waterburyi]|uniref:ATP-dependent zinc protease family protein n=1 Tax=Teredinibacter waterburyi TaxID=1500538 RepID=UPI001CAA86A9|nr:ATP-dependent zinc protease [Teredinibacter waterburyi]
MGSRFDWGGSTEVYRYFCLKVVLICGLLVASGCTFSNQKNTDAALQEKAEQLARHSDLLLEQAEQLDSLQFSQQALTEQLELMQLQIQDVHEVVTGESAPVTASVPVGSPAAIPVDNTSDVQPKTTDKLVLGRVEWVWLPVAQQRYKARIDTGAATSSISAVDVQRFERDGKRWVRFTVPGEGGSQAFETPLLHHKKIRQASLEELERRPVVELLVQVGDKVEGVEFTLTDRNKMLYPVLLGRNFLQDFAMVDVSLKFTQSRKLRDSLAEKAQTTAQKKAPQKAAQEPK